MITTITPIQERTPPRRPQIPAAQPRHAMINRRCRSSRKRECAFTNAAPRGGSIISTANHDVAHLPRRSGGRRARRREQELRRALELGFKNRAAGVSPLPQQPRAGREDRRTRVPSARRRDHDTLLEREGGPTPRRPRALRPCAREDHRRDCLAALRRPGARAIGSCSSPATPVPGDTSEKPSPDHVVFEQSRAKRSVPPRMIERSGATAFSAHPARWTNASTSPTSRDAAHFRKRRAADLKKPISKRTGFG